MHSVADGNKIEISNVILKNFYFFKLKKTL